ncbi:hypothetical protein P9112_005785 [Eukaryota sp. TZLM1-RC]
MSDQTLSLRRFEHDLVSFFKTTTSSSFSEESFWYSLIDFLGNYSSGAFFAVSPSLRVISILRSALTHLRRSPSLAHISLIPALEQLFSPCVIHQLCTISPDVSTSSLSSLSSQVSKLTLPPLGLSSKTQTKSSLLPSLSTLPLNSFDLPSIKNTPITSRKSSRLGRKLHMENQPRDQERFLKTSDDAVSYFVNNPDDSIKFVFLTDMTSPSDLDWDPYLLSVVSGSTAHSKSKYYTLSAKGVVEMSKLRGRENELDYTDLKTWIKHSGIFRILKCLSFFKNNLLFRFFIGWKLWLRTRKFNDSQALVYQNLYFVRPYFKDALFRIKNILHEINHSNLIELSFDNRWVSLNELSDQQSTVRESAISKIKNHRNTIIDIITEVQESIHKRTQLKPSNLIDFDGEDEFSERSMSMVEAKKVKWERKRAVEEARQEATRFDRFIKMIDLMLMTSLWSRLHDDCNHVLSIFQTLNHHTDSRHEGLLLTSVNFKPNTRHLTFSPNFEEFSNVWSSIFADTDSILNSVPLIASSNHFKSIINQSSVDFDLATLLSQSNEDLTATRSEIINQIKLSYKRAAQSVTSFESTWREVYEFSQTEFKELESIVARWDNKTIISRINLFESWNQLFESTGKKQSSVGVLIIDRRLLREFLTDIPIKSLIIIKEQVRLLFSQLYSELTEEVRTCIKHLSGGSFSPLSEFCSYVGLFNEIKQKTVTIESRLSFIEDLYATGQRYKCGFTVSESSKFSSLKSTINTFDTVLASSQCKIDENLPSIRSQLAEVSGKIESGLLGILGDLYSPILTNPKSDPNMVMEKLAKIQQKLSHYEASIEEIHSFEKLLSRNLSDFHNYGELVKLVKARNDTWRLLDTWNSQEIEWVSSDIRQMDLNKVSGQVDQAKDIIQSVSTVLKKDEVIDLVQSKVIDFEKILQKIIFIKESHLKNHHWSDIFHHYDVLAQSTTSLIVPTISMLLQHKILENDDYLISICQKALSEHDLYCRYESIYNTWRGVEVQIASDEFNISKIDFDCLIKQVDLHLIELSSILNDPLSESFSSDISNFQSFLTNFDLMLQSAQQLQNQLLFCAGFFSRAVARQLARDQSREFDLVTSTWETVIQAKFSQADYIETFFSSSICSSLSSEMAELKSNLKTSFDSLLKRFDRDREGCPWLCLFSNEELLEFSVMSRDQIDLCQVVSQIFPFLFELLFKGNEISGLETTNSEILFFTESISSFSGDLSLFINQIYKSITSSVNESLWSCLEDYNSAQRPQWIKQFPHSVIITCEAVFLTKSVDLALTRHPYDPGSIDSAKNQLMTNVEEMLLMVKSKDLGRELKDTLFALLLMNSNAVNLLEKAESTTMSVTDKKWLKNTRFFWNSELHHVMVKRSLYSFKLGNFVFESSPQIDLFEIDFERLLAEWKVSQVVLFNNICFQDFKFFSNYFGFHCLFLDASIYPLDRLICIIESLSSVPVWLYVSNLGNSQVCDFLEIDPQSFHQNFGLFVESQSGPQTISLDEPNFLNFLTLVFKAKSWVNHSKIAWNVYKILKQCEDRLNNKHFNVILTIQNCISWSKLLPFGFDANLELLATSLLKFLEKYDVDLKLDDVIQCL